MEINVSGLLTVVVPAYNEMSVLEEFHCRMTQVMSATGMDYEIIYVDDGSTDGTAGLLSRLRDDDPAVAVI